MSKRTYFLNLLWSPVLGLATVLIFFQYHWGYWWPPSSQATAAELVTLDRYSCFHGDDVTSGAEALAEKATFWQRQGWEYYLFADPRGRLAAALVARGLSPASNEQVDIPFRAVVSALEAAGGVKEEARGANPGYHGCLGTGQSTAGQSITVAELVSRPGPTDHHHEMVLAPSADGRLTLRSLRSHGFNEEDTAQWLWGFGVAWLVIGIWLLVGIALARRWWRARRAATW